MKGKNTERKEKKKKNCKEKKCQKKQSTSNIMLDADTNNVKILVVLGEHDTASTTETNLRLSLFIQIYTLCPRSLVQHS